MANFLLGLFKVLQQRNLPDHGIPEFLPWPDGEAETLVVFTHEWGGSGWSRQQMKRVLWGQASKREKREGDTDEIRSLPVPEKAPLGKVDLLVPVLVANPLSNQRPQEAAWSLQKRIHTTFMERAQAGRPYRSVVLVGYSAGSLVLRKAMVWGLGQIEDHTEKELAREYRWRWALDETGTRLGGTIGRIVLIAGINRGWSLQRRPGDMSLPLYLSYKILERVARLGLFGRFILALERGEPFVADLRLQWLRLAHRLGGLPPTFQLLGTVDDIVSRDDNKDVLALSNAHVLLVEGADHAGIMRLHETAHGPARRERLIEALTGHVELEDRITTDMDRAYGEAALRADRVTAEAASSADPAISMIVLPIHGIRANADWCNRFRRLLNQSLQKGAAYCPCRSYGHFSILRFLLIGRRKMVRWFVDLYTEAVAAVGDTAVPVHVVGHSNGTYLLARALLDYRTINVDHVALTGSVVQRHFPWSQLHDEGRLKRLRNKRAARDFIVGFFPGFYQQLSMGLPGVRTIFDIGNAGLRGFDDPPKGQDIERFYLDGGHGAGVEEANLPHLVDFILDRPEQPRQLAPRIPLWIDLFSNLAWAVWLLSLLAIMAIAYGLWTTSFNWLAIVLFAVLLVIIIATV